MAQRQKSFRIISMPGRSVFIRKTCLKPTKFSCARLKKLASFDAEFRVLLENKSVHWIRAKAQVIGDNNKKAIAMLGMNWDITAEKQLVHDLFTEKERLSTT